LINQIPWWYYRGQKDETSPTRTQKKQQVVKNFHLLYLNGKSMALYFQTKQKQ
jgi:hypothetical protein